jgi:hypothetical protein
MLSKCINGTDLCYSYAVARKDTKEFTRDMALKNEDKTLKTSKCVP